MNGGRFSSKMGRSVDVMIETLYRTKRELQERGQADEPYFVWMAVDKKQMHEIEAVILGWLVEKYGFDPEEAVRQYDVCPTDNQTTFSFPQHGFRLSIVVPKAASQC